MIVSRPRHSLSSPCPRTKMLPGMSIVMSSAAGRPVAMVRGGGARGLPVLPLLISTTFMHDHIRRQAVRQVDVGAIDRSVAR